MSIRSRRGGVCQFGFIETMFYVLLDEIREACRFAKMTAILRYASKGKSLTCTGLYNQGFLRGPGCMQLFLCFFNLFKFPFLIIYLQYLHITIQYLQTYNTYILLDGLVCSVVRYF